MSKKIIPDNIVTHRKSDMLKKNMNILYLFLLTQAVAIPWTLNAVAQDGQAIIENSFNYMRGKASISTVVMTIHRPDWERQMTIKAWTMGEKDSLFRIIEPAKDRGNGTLKKGREMWMYNPKINRVIKLPPSMMSQAWMGSDFSNNDLAKSDSMIHDYRHTITGTETHEGKIVYLIDSIPKPGAPVVWGMQKLKIREDHVFLYQGFFDEDMELVKALTFLEIQMIGGKLYPKKWKMQKTNEFNKFTVVEYSDLIFKKELPKSLFTLSRLRNPGRF
jgi:outer membrane lipoprotein-sorting protein